MDKAWQGFQCRMEAEGTQAHSASTHPAHQLLAGAICARVTESFEKMDEKIWIKMDDYIMVYIFHGISNQWLIMVMKNNGIIQWDNHQ